MSSRQDSGLFLAEFADFRQQIDALASDAFNGELLDKLCSEFLARHQPAIELHEEAASKSVMEDKLDEIELLKEDDKLLSQRPIDEQSARQHRLAEDGANGAETEAVHWLLWRSCQARYLSISLQLTRANRHQDRRLPVLFARRSLRQSNGWHCFRACYWFMVSLGWLIEDPQSRRSGRELTLMGQCFRSACQRCAELRPSDPLAHHLLGRYLYRVASLNWIERSLANRWLAGDRKLEGSFEEAKRQFLVAHRLKADWLPTGLWMAKCLEAQGSVERREELAGWLKFGLEQECREPSSELDRRQIIELRDKLKLNQN